MDPYKKIALIKWLDALTDKKTESFNDVRDGTRLVTILKAFDDHFLPSDTPIGTVEERFVAIRTYLEGFYSQSLSDNSLVNFDMLIQNTVQGPVYDLELGKLLLALLGALVQDKYREQFVNPAFHMDKRSQVELKTMIESVLFTNELETQLPKELDVILKRRTDAGPVVALYTYSPGGAVASPVMSVREISSPFRVMSRNSPQASATSPLVALMKSPQLAQKALLRQHITEIKRLETSLQHQEHRRSEMRHDLEDRAQDLKEKEKRIRDLERQVGKMRSLWDDLDELEQLKVDNERMTKDNTKLQAKLSEYQGIKEHCQELEREHKEVLDEVQQTRKEEQMNKLRWKEMQCELSRVQLLMKEQEVEIGHRHQQNAELTQSLEDARSRYTFAQQQIAALKTEKEELEEALGTRHGMNGLQSSLGESMNVVVEKRLAELQKENEKMRTTWVDPDQHHKIEKELSQCRTEPVLTRRVAELKKELSVSEGKLKKKMEELQQLEKQLVSEESLQTELNSLLADKKSLELDLHKTKLELQSANDLYNSKFQKSELKYKDSESAFTQEIEKLNGTLKEQYQVEKGLRVEVSKLNKLIIKYKEEIEKLTKTLEKLTHENKRTCSELEESKLQTVNLQVKVNNLQEQFDHECEQNLTALKKKDSSIRELEKRLETFVNDLSLEKTELSEQINSLHQSVAEKSKECLLQKEAMLEDMRLLKENHERVIMEMNDKNRGLISEKDVQLNNIKSELDDVKETMEVKKAKLEQTVKNSEQNSEEKHSEIAKLKESAAELEFKFSTIKEEAKTERDALKSELEKAKVLQAETEANLNSVKESGQSDIANLKEKLFKTEHYWRSQCEQLEEEYSKGAAEQKEEYNAQLSAAGEKFEDKLQQLDEKDMFIANQQQAYMERIHGLERAISEKKEENGKLRDNFKEERTQLEKQVEELNGKLKEESEKHRIKCEELESVQQEIVSMRENHVTEVERLVCQNKGELEALRQSLGCENTGVVKELTEQHDSEVNKLRAENEEQKAQYQGMISDLEGRLDSETLDLKERLSQMKCQYETVIETNQKENRNQNREWEKKIMEARNKVTNLENKLKEQTQTVESLQNQCSNYLVSNSELQSSLERLQVDKSELEVKTSNTEVNMNNLKEKLETLEKDLIGAREDVNRERGEREETERQLSFLRDQNDTLSAELSSQQQQLATVEEEKRVLEAERTEMRASHTSSLEDLRVQSEKDLKFSNIEKMELERQLQSSQKCYEAVQKSKHELESQVEKLREEKSHAESRLRELEQRVFSLMEREKKIMEDNQHQVDKAAELNGTLRRQLDEKCHEVTELNNRFTKEEAVQKSEHELESQVDESTSAQLEKNLQEMRDSLLADKKSFELDLHKTKLELQSANDLYNSEFQKSELKYKDSELAFTQEIEKLKWTLKEQYQVEKGLRVEVSKLNQLIIKYKEEIKQTVINREQNSDKLKTESETLTQEKSSAEPPPPPPSQPAPPKPAPPKPAQSTISQMVAQKRPMMTAPPVPPTMAQPVMVTQRPPMQVLVPAQPPPEPKGEDDEPPNKRQKTCYGTSPKFLAQRLLRKYKVKPSTLGHQASSTEHQEPASQSGTSTSSRSGPGPSTPASQSGTSTSSRSGPGPSTPASQSGTSTSSRSGPGPSTPASQLGTSTSSRSGPGPSTPASQSGTSTYSRSGPGPSTPASQSGTSTSSGQKVRETPGDVKKESTNSETPVSVKTIFAQLRKRGRVTPQQHGNL